jgi:protein arginine N-methyltransferase 1
MFNKSSFRRFIYARDKWLKKDGLILPDCGPMYISGGHDNIHQCIQLNLRQSKSVYNKRIDWWAHNIYGSNTSAIRRSVLAQPNFQQIEVKQIVTNSLLQHFDFYKISLEDINFNTFF